MEGMADWDKINLRVPPGIRTAMKIEAAKNRRSLNGEIVHQLEKLYEPYAAEIEDAETA